MQFDTDSQIQTLLRQIENILRTGVGDYIWLMPSDARLLYEALQSHLREEKDDKVSGNGE